jgi:hypothetical protein
VRRPDRPGDPHLLRSPGPPGDVPAPARLGLEPAYGRVWWAGVVVGGGLLAFGLVGLIRDAAATVPPAWAGWLLAALLVHDLVLVPAVFVVARLLRRVPAAWRPEVRWALTLSGVVVTVTLPAFLGDGRATQPGNTSVLPNDYTLSFALVVGLVWVAAAATALARAVRQRRAEQRP